MQYEPLLLHEVTNKLGQKIEFFEHPLKGDESPVIAVYHEEQIAVDTDFFDCDDFFPGSEYNPVYKNGKMITEWEL